MSQPSRFSFAPNIDSRGRLVRALGAVTSAVIAMFVSRRSIAGGVVVGAASLFLGFEALRGWCALRACGVKTKL